MTQSALDEMDPDRMPGVRLSISRTAARVVAGAHRLDILRSLMTRMSSEGGGAKLVKAVVAAADRQAVRQELGQLA